MSVHTSRWTIDMQNGSSIKSMAHPAVQRWKLPPANSLGTGDAAQGRWQATLRDVRGHLERGGIKGVDETILVCSSTASIYGLGRLSD